MKLICATPVLSALNLAMKVSRRLTYCEFSAKALTILRVVSCAGTGRGSRHAAAIAATARRGYLTQSPFEVAASRSLRAHGEIRKPRPSPLAGEGRVRGS